MNKSDIISSLVEKNLGYLVVSDATAEGISRQYVTEYANSHGFERVAKGLYISEDAWPDGMYVIQMRYPHVVFSHETALYLCGLAEREPLRYTVTACTGQRTSYLSLAGVKVYTVKKELLEVGLSEMDSPMGHRLRVYDAERTVVDLLRSRSNVEIQTMQTALKEYVASKSKNVPQLMRIAKQFSVDKIISQYLEVLL